MALVKRTGFIRFSRWGAYLGRLNVTAAKHADALDGTDEIKITCKDDVSKGDYIVWFDDKGKAHEHIVDEADRTHGEDGTVSTTFTGVNSIAELWDDWTDDIRPSGTVGVALDRALLGTRWTVGTCDLTTESSVVLYHQSVRESIAEILNAWGGELETEIITNGSCVIERRVGVRAVRGNQSSPKRFTWTKDIKSITRTVSSENPKTRVYGYGRGVETDSGGFGRRLTFESINDGKEYVEDAEATKIWGHPERMAPFCHLAQATSTNSARTKRSCLPKRESSQRRRQNRRLATKHASSTFTRSADRGKVWGLAIRLQSSTRALPMTA